MLSNVLLHECRERPGLVAAAQERKTEDVRGRLERALGLDLSQCTGVVDRLLRVLATEEREARAAESEPAAAAPAKKRKMPAWCVD